MRGQNYVQPLDINGSPPLSPAINAAEDFAAENGPEVPDVDIVAPADNDELLSDRTGMSLSNGDSVNKLRPVEDGTFASKESASDLNETAAHPMLPAMDKVLPMTISEALETIEEKKLRKQSHLIVYFTAFIMSIGFSIVMTSVWPYLKQLDNSASKVFYGLVIAVNPLGQLLTAPLLGWWGNRAGSNRPAFLASVFFYVLGNVMYGMLRLMHGPLAAYSLMVSRFVVGMGSAIQTALAVAIPVAAPAHNATSSDVAPALPLWDLYTAAGWIAALLGLINFVLFMPCIYKEMNIAAREAQMMKDRLQNSALDYPKPDLWAVFVVLLNFFFVLFLYVLLETIVVPMSKDLYGWSSEFAIKVVGIGLSIVGIVAFFMFFVTTILCKYFDERKIYIGVGLVPLVLAMIIHFPMGSNYPLMQNCTALNQSNIAVDLLDSSPSPLDSLATTETLLRNRRYIDGSRFSVETGNGKISFLTAVPDERFIHNTSKVRSVITHDSNSSAKKNTNKKGFIFSYLKTYGYTVSRVRRAALIDDEDGCDAVGCPVSQQWCLYTPIVEIPQLVIANVIGVIGYPAAFSLSSSIFSKMIGPKSQGIWMGLMTSTGSLSRMTGPIFVTWIYSSHGTRWTFGVLAVVLAGTVVLSLIFYKRLVPMDINKNLPIASVNTVS
ncbi:major facilitator superfamily domain-containing protein 8 isoform X2 [Hyalella azteca]|uniref:Major facilitator superfamily domain-containing protein 8 isoform X2 n=1 Tax=Hyalella azteca TaxID=294128 RepID=A0A979FT50_HYAAZ|nr:major facilitator superfamily domain-containing protein 8 isoform X2 [Hyalella azteca]